MTTQWPLLSMAPSAGRAQMAFTQLQALLVPLPALRNPPAKFKTMNLNLLSVKTKLGSRDTPGGSPSFALMMLMGLYYSLILRKWGAEAVEEVSIEIKMINVSIVTTVFIKMSIIIE